MAIRQVITFRVRAGSGQAFRDGFAPIIAAVRNEPGCEQYELFAPVDGGDTFVMLERWADRAALDDALKKLYPGKDNPSVAFFQLVEGPPQREVYEV
jgi:quinol monooxygenase YgiN